MLVDDAPLVLPLGRLCDDLGYSYSWWLSKENHIFTEGKSTFERNIENFVRTRTDTVHNSLNKAHQLHRLRPQNAWIQFPDAAVWQKT